MKVSRHAKIIELISQYDIETQEEFDMVSEVFDSIVEDGEYDEIIEE